MTAPSSYPTAPYIEPEPRWPGWHDAWCRVTFTPADGDGDPRVIVGPYLDAHSPRGRISLGDGVEAAAHDLGLTDEPVAALIAVADAVSDQLAQWPGARVRCPRGSFEVQLIAVPDPAVAPNGAGCPR